ncbi:MAG: hypothetical protein WDN46_05825 [Methylocella sp.]
MGCRLDRDGQGYVLDAAIDEPFEQLPRNHGLTHLAAVGVAVIMIDLS